MSHRKAATGAYGLRLVYEPSKEHLMSPLECDIYIFHGLNGDAEHTFTDHDGNKSINWTKDQGFLPSKFPLSRIFVMTYNAAITSYGSDATLSDIGAMVLSAIANTRLTDEEKARKALFIAHSLGGWVAIVAVLNEDPLYQDIRQSVVGIVFLGTPHGGSWLAVPLARIAFFTGSPKPLLKVLLPGSSYREELGKKFEEYYSRRQQDPMSPFQIVNFREHHKVKPRWSPVGIRVVPRSSAICNFPGERIEEAEKDHHSIARFRTPEDTCFKAIVRHAKDFLHVKLLPPIVLLPKQSSRLIYEVRSACDDFCGREDDLAKIETALFNVSPGNIASLAIWGSAGMGKTQTMLKYAFMNSARYELIFTFDACSENKLRASVESLFDLLLEREDSRLLDMPPVLRKDKCKTVMTWLQEGKNWLIIYEDVDLDPEYDIRSYFPQHCSGHRVLISRDRRITAYTRTELLLREMTDNDARKMILKRAGIHEPTGEDKKDATRIAIEVDKTPQFIEFAASYVRNNCSSLSEYLRDIRTQKRNMILWSPKGLIGDKFAAWELIFEKIAQSPSALLLGTVFAFLDGSTISTVLIRRATEPQRRWGKDGEVISHTTEDDNIDHELLELLRDRDAFKDALQPLLKNGFINNDKAVFKMPQMVQHLLFNRLTSRQRLQFLKMVIRLVSHAFPEEVGLERDFSSIKGTLLPHVHRCVDLAKRFEVDSLKDVAEPLLSMLLSSLSGSTTEKGLLEYADDLLKITSCPYHRGLAAKWKAYILWHEKQIPEAEALLASALLAEEQLLRVPRLTSALDFLNSDNGDCRTYAILGDLVMHDAQFLIAAGNHARAEEILKRWKPQGMNEMERRTKLHVDTALAKGLLCRNKFAEAIGMLEGLLKLATQARFESLQESHFNWATVLLGQAYCAVNKFDKAIKLLLERVQFKLKNGQQAEFITSDYRIILAEAYIRNGDDLRGSRELNSLKQDLEDTCHSDSNPRAQTQLLNVKSLRARSLYLQKRWQEARREWQEYLKALDVDDNQVQDLSQNKNFDAALGVLALTLIDFYLGNHEQAERRFVVFDANPHLLMFPASDINYTHWSDRLKLDFEAVRPLRERQRQVRAGEEADQTGVLAL